ncbi:MAG: hypothetical protein ACRBCS_02965 [Cellvibrionaceae bacterium]
MKNFNAYEDEFPRERKDESKKIVSDSVLTAIDNFCDDWKEENEVKALKERLVENVYEMLDWFYVSDSEANKNYQDAKANVLSNIRDLRIHDHLKSVEDQGRFLGKQAQ